MVENELYDVREFETDLIRNAYRVVEESLRTVGKLLRSTEAGQFLWSAEHKTAISGLRVLVKRLRQDVPHYRDAS